ncbi:MAG: PAS domain-containing sensor histidine kinase [Clostridia bacterium]|nr:PAS domain-containing sensor histidine kinase [Clostridia bacterium]
MDEKEYLATEEKISYDPVSAIQTNRLDYDYDDDYLIHDAWYKAIIQNTSEGFFISDLKGKFLDVNDAYCSMTGYTRSELLKMGLYDIELSVATYPEDRIKMERYFQEVKERGENYNEFLEVKHKCKDGHIIDISVCMKYMDIMGGILFHFERDITESKRLFKQVQESEELYRSLIDLGGKAGEAVVMIHCAKEFKWKQIFVSDKWSDMTGYSKSELLEKSFIDMVKPFDKKKLLKRDICTINDENIPCLFELNVIRKDGTEFPIEVTSAISTYHGDKVNVIYIRDITDRKKLENSVQDYQKQLEKLVYERTQALEEKIQKLEKYMQNRIKYTRALIHELKTPLTPLMASSEFLRSELEDTIPLRFANNIYEGALNLSKRIDELLDLAKSETGMLEIKTEPVQMDCLIKSTISYIKPEIMKKNLSFNSVVQKNLPTIDVDEGRIRQVLLNLIDNAMKYTPIGGKITLRVSKKNDCIVIRVKDTGVGIDRKDLAYLFEPYHRLESGIIRSDGMGLGLYISKTIVELHGGHISIKSQKDGGSTFSVWLPLKSIE